MNYTILSSIDFFNSQRWNSESFLTDLVETAQDFCCKTVFIKDVVKERKEFINPFEHQDHVFNYIGLENIAQNTPSLVDFFPKNGGEIKSRCKIFRKGDVLYGRLRPTLNKCLFVDDFLQEGICSTEIFTLIPRKNLINSFFLVEILLSRILLDKVSSLTVGASLPRLHIKDFLNLKIPLPDLEIQNLLAEKVLYYRNKEKWHRQSAKRINEEISEKLISSLDNIKNFNIHIDECVNTQKFDNKLPSGDFYVKERRSRLLKIDIP